MSAPRLACGECGGSLLYREGGWVHLRRGMGHEADLQVAEDPALAGLPVDWVWEDGGLRRATPLDNL
jgi:hypothetical protein